MNDERARVVARLTKLMQRSDGWTTIMPPEVGEAYERTLRTINGLPRKRQRLAKIELLRMLAGLFGDSAINNGLSYEKIAADITEMERRLDG